MAGGRPSKFDQAKIDLFLKTIADVGTVGDAAIIAGLKEDTVYHWLARGKRSRSGRFRKFFEDYRKAQAERDLAGEREVKEHGKKDWRARAWLMSVQTPKKYSTKVHRVLEQEFFLANKRIRTAFEKLDPSKTLTPAEAKEIALAAASGEMDGVQTVELPEDPLIGDQP